MGVGKVKKANRAKTLTIAVICLVFVVMIGVLYFLQYEKINTMFPSPKTVTANFNSDVIIEDFNVSVSSFDIYDIEELKTKFSIDPRNVQSSGTDDKVALVGVKLKNCGDQEETINAGEFVLESVTWANGSDSDMFLYVNDKDAKQNPTLAPNEEVTIFLPYSISDVQFNKADWNKIKERSFKLVLSMYPIKHTIAMT